MIIRFSGLSVVLALAVPLFSQSSAPREQVGPTPDGGYLLNSGWKLTPAGKQVPLDTFPMSSALSKDGRHLLVLNGGVNPPSISVLRTDTMEELGRTPVADAWLGLTFSSDGKLVYVGGGSRASVFEFAFNDGKLEPKRTFAIPEKQRTPRDFIGDVAVSPDGRLLYAANLYGDAIHLINLQTGVLIEKLPTGRRPYRILFHPDGKSYFVSSWADGAVYHHKAETGERVATIRLAQHPTDMVWRPRKQTENDELQQGWIGRIFVAAAHTNSVYVLGVGEDGEVRTIENINLALTPNQPLGMTPSALAMNADQSRLYVACSDANTVAVTDISESTSAVLGYVPTGWYPTAVRSLADGRLVVLNGKGTGKTGTASVIPPLTDELLDEYSETVLRNSAFRDAKLEDAGVPPGNPIPNRPGEPSPIEHVIYIVKDGPRVVFDAKTTPNQRKIAQEYVLFDNFYVSSDTAADGASWSAAAIASDYVQKMAPNSTGGRRREYDYEGGEPASTPPAGYLWTNASAAGLPMRNYGWWTTNIPQAQPAGQNQISAVRDHVLVKVTNPKFRGPDKNYPDTDRVKAFLDDLAVFEKAGTMPKLIFLRLGGDQNSMADSDRALGAIVEAVSKSRFWPKAAIFMAQASTQGGADRVDSHRASALAISPYTRRGTVDSTMYNTASVLRTIELILGLRPMTQFDAAARPLWAAFSSKPDLTPYQAVNSATALDRRNAEGSQAAMRRQEAPAPVRNWFSR